MIIELDRKGLEMLVRGTSINFNEFNNSLAVKAGLDYSDQYGRVSWDKLSDLTEEELYVLYIICRDSWEK